MQSQSVGIQDFGICLPKHYLPIEALANKRNIEVAKLQKGLGLMQMPVCDSDEDVPYLAAKAILDLVDSQVNNGNYPDAISFFSGVDKIYLGTESAVDAAKPSITYAIETLQSQLNCSLGHIDFLDMTFACIGGVDALHQCLDYIRLRPNRRCIVVAADKAVYDQNTGGEYTQGAGAVAFLLSSKPDLIEFTGEVGVAIKHDFDFYKPKRHFRKIDLIDSLLKRLGIDKTAVDSNKYDQLLEANPVLKKETLEGWVEDFWDLPGNFIPVLRDEPVYDGQFSNSCYEERVGAAVDDFLTKNNLKTLPEVEQWVFHLPYAYQGRRMAVKIWWEKDLERNLELKNQIIAEYGNPEINDSAAYAQWLKAISKSEAYLKFVANAIAPTDRVSSEVGNLYTASIFMAFLSGLAYSEGDLVGKSVLFLAYGSGSKSKVFKGNYGKQANSSEVARRLQYHLSNRVAIDFDAYEKLKLG